MEKKETPNKSEKDIIKENMLALYKAYQQEDKNPISEISYYSQIVLQNEKSHNMYGIQDVYPVVIPNAAQSSKDRIVLYQDKKPFAIIDENSNIKFLKEYLMQMKQIDPSIYGVLALANNKHYELPQLQEVNEKLPDINSKQKVENFALTKEELENARQEQMLADMKKNENLELNGETEFEEPKNEEQSMEQIAKQAGISKDDLKSCSSINPHERITDQKSFEDVANVTGKYSKIFVVFANSKTNGNSLYSFWGMTKDGKMEQIPGLEEHEGVNTGKTIYSINRDGSQVKEQQTSALFTMPNQREGFSVSIGQYGIIETTYIRRSPNENKYIGSTVNSSTQKPTTREVQEFMNDSRTTDAELKGTINKTEHQLGETFETKLRNIDDNPSNDAEIDLDQEITLHDGTTTTLAKEAEKLGISPVDYKKQFVEKEAGCYADKIEMIREEHMKKTEEQSDEHEMEHEERKERSLENDAWERMRKRGIIE